MAQLVIAAAGAAIGFAIGEPTGAQIGFTLGSAIGAPTQKTKKALAWQTVYKYIGDNPTLNRRDCSISSGIFKRLRNG